MTFPYYINIFGLHIHPHIFFEYLAMFVGYRVYKLTKTRQTEKLTSEIGIFLTITLGGYFGAVLLASLEHYDRVLMNISTTKLALIQGKTIVGALLGGLICVEIYKKCIGYKKSTGDDIAIPLIVAIMIGRIGCFLTGPADATVGRETDFIFGFDFGEGIYRHPLQLYEIAFLGILLCVLIFIRKKEVWNGFKFQLFMLSYLTFRFFIEFLKDRATVVLSLSAIQLACVFGIIYYTQLIYKKLNLHTRR